MKFSLFWAVISAAFGAALALYFAEFPNVQFGAKAGRDIVETRPLRQRPIIDLAPLYSFLSAKRTNTPQSVETPVLQQNEQSILADSTANQRFTPDELINIAVYEKASPSVCNIDTVTQRGFRLMLNAPPIEGSGSGWVLDKFGHVVTNHHVVDGSDAITVTLTQGEPFPARVVGADPQNDIAVLKIEAPPELLHPVTLGSSKNLKVGQRVFAIGSPFGLERTMTVGIVSSLERAIQSPRTKRMIKKIIQVDAALNQGNSGGPLLDSQGNLVGMNTAIASATGENTGVGFAIPVDTISRFVPQLIQFGEVRRASLGIELFWKADRGLGVIHPTENGPAMRAGIRGAGLARKIVRTRRGLEEAIEVDQKRSDIILAIDGAPVSSTDDLQDILDQLQPGRVVNLTILRDGLQQAVPVELGLE
jgi:S1-C subfamily serine protease